ncbi:MAG: integrase [Acidiferrobacter sp.]
MLTAEIIRVNSGTHFHLRPECELDEVWVSSRSRWRDALWWLDNPSIGQRPLASKVTWDMKLPDGRNLLDPEHSQLLGWLRRFVWSLFVDPRDKAKAYKTGNGGMLTQGLRVVVPWMVERGQMWPKDVNKEFVAAFIDDLPSIVAVEVDDEEVIREGAAYMPLKIIDLLWRQRLALGEAGISPMPERPWLDEKGANSIAKRIITEARGWIRPLPDEVAIPLMNKAAWFLGAPAEDVLRLREKIEKVYRPIETPNEKLWRLHQARRKRMDAALSDYAFSIIDGESASWHEPLTSCQAKSGRESYASRRVRQLVATVAGAACITIQSSTGMRASEICALRAGTCPDTGLPRGVRIVETASGLNEAFVLRSELTKEEEVPRDVDWLLGMRPKSSDEIPLPVRAMQVLDRLFAHERKLAKTDRLLITTKSGVDLAVNETQISLFNTPRLNRFIKNFIQRWVDLSDLPDESAHRITRNDLIPWRESKGRIIRPHQFRKTYAQFALSIDPRLLPAVQRQYHHVAMAITEGGYWGRNRIQIEPINAMAAQLTAMQMYEMVTGRTKVAGKMGAQLEEGIDEVRKLVEGVDMEVGWRRVMRFVRDNSLHMWFAPHGNCFPMDPGAMGCHKAAGTRPIGVPFPNFTTREPSLCAGCDCFILDLRHVGFWQERYITNAAAHRQAEARGQGGMFRVAAMRAAVAKKLLERLGINTAPLDLCVEREIADVEH